MLNLKFYLRASCPWLMPAILPDQKAEIRRIKV
jgi:hypothetical protein